MQISPMTEADFAAFWPCFQAIIAAQETYAFEPDLTQQQAYQLWCELPLQSWVAKDAEGQILGSYYLKANAAGPGKHVCNCGYMVNPAAQGQGVASALCQHSQQQARAAGFYAMQFNSVVSSNHRAVALWQRLGFRIVGTLPGAYRHPRLGLVDSYVMYKVLV
ncbi:GNAT family N-acetyltransferase [Balneatrix alpica]|uniref:GNAT family N-acetyltransferase n=1 Tax=Balneatrix alpica TaxID=75684 RepID=A0ABV5ZF78_9GAMM|nr:GNAT family N-acetyltransferase [Balneatrix alpica]